jgi:DNA-binding MarR family transcriptional regulator
MNGYDAIESLAIAFRRQQTAMLRPFGISLRQYELVSLARRRLGLSLAEAANLLDCDRPTMTLIVRRCVAFGWLSRKPSRKDGRSSLLALAGRGEELLDRIEAERAAWEARSGDPLDVLTVEERALFLRTADRVARRARDVWGDDRSLGAPRPDRLSPESAASRSTGTVDREAARAPSRKLPRRPSS